MAAWRTDIENAPQGRKFDVIVVDADGERYRVTDCSFNATRQICEYDSSWGWEPVEHHFSDKDFRRVTHWAPIDLPDG